MGNTQDILHIADESACHEEFSKFARDFLIVQSKQLVGWEEEEEN